jgi:uncharacterized damage-inducible protein DinB
MADADTFSEPDPHVADPAELFIGYLAAYRDTVVRKLQSLPVDALRASVVPSGWTPLGLVWHLAHMERRWFEWGFRGEDVPDPWADSSGDPDGGWVVPADLTAADVTSSLTAVGEATNALLRQTPLSTVAAIGGRFDDDPPALSWICFHVLQEYARHAGHLDIAVEIAGGHRGE